MHFEFSEDQNLLIESCRSFFRQNFQLDDLRDFQARKMSPEIWQKLIQLGWQGILCPAELGGSEGTVFHAALLLREAGRACFPSYSVQAWILASQAISLCGSEAQKTRWLPDHCQGRELTALLLSPELAPRCPASALPFRVDASSQTVSGSMKLSFGGVQASSFLLPVSMPDGAGFGLVRVASNAPGVSRSAVPALSYEQGFDLSLNRFPLESGALIGPIPADRFHGILALGALLQSAELSGASEQALEVAVEYAKIRHQFNRPIGSFQAIQHSCAEVLAHVERIKFLVFSAAFSFDQSSDSGRRVSLAKAVAADEAAMAVRRVHQILGGIGYTDEHPLHFFHKRILAGATLCGSSASHWEQVAQGLGLER